MAEEEKKSPMATRGEEEVAILGGGCFWCVEAAFQMARGVSKVESGYAGGCISAPESKDVAPTYKTVCEGKTGHAEVVRISYDPRQISFKDLLTIFFTVHDPTTLNAQGADSGTQYRSIILPLTPEQKQVAETTIAELAPLFAPKKIVTQISAETNFWPAETTHQNYYERNTEAKYCKLVINPKLKELRKKCAGMFNKQYTT